MTHILAFTGDGKQNIVVKLAHTNLDQTEKSTFSSLLQSKTQLAFQPWSMGKLAAKILGCV